MYCTLTIGLVMSHDPLFKFVINIPD